MQENTIMQIEKITEIASQIAAEVALNTFNREKENAILQRKDKRLRNTQKLLEHYRLLKEHRDNAIYQVRQLDDDSDMLDIMAIMENALMYEEFHVESIKKSAQRTALIMEHISEMLKVFKFFCINSAKVEELRKYDVISGLYIDAIPRSIADLAEQYYCDNSTIYRDQKAAIAKLSTLLFGIDGIK